MEPIGTLYYFGDPMCSWCWGFRPVLEQATQEYPELRRVLVMGGLRGGEAEPMPDDLAAMVQGAWHRIEESTGQPFNHDLWALHRPLATTWPACRAVLSARLLDGEREWAYMVAMFKAYFTQARDPSLRETQLEVAETLGFDRESFAQQLDDDGTQAALLEDLRLGRRLGITGYPTLVLNLGESYYLVSPGYQPIEGLRKAINAAYAEHGVAYTRPESGLYS